MTTIVMGIGAAAIPVLSIIAVTKLLPEGKRGMGIGVISAAGPAVGGGIGQFLGWPGLFWLMLVVALVLLPAALRVLPDETPAGAGRFDVPGGILLGLGSGLFLFGFTQAQVAGFVAASSWVSLVVAFLAMIVNLGALVFVPLLVVDVNGLDPGAGALVMIPAGAAVAVLSPLIGRLADGIGTRPLVLTGLTTMGLFGCRNRDARNQRRLHPRRDPDHQRRHRPGPGRRAGRRPAASRR